MDPAELTWSELTDPDEHGESMLSRWASDALEEAQERAVNLYLLGSTWARDEARLHLAIHDGVRSIVAERNPLLEGIRVAVRAAAGVLEVLEQSLRPLQTAGVLTRTGEFRRPTAHTFALDDIHPGARLHVQTRGDRFMLDITHKNELIDDAEWVLAGPGGSLVASGGGGASFPSVAPGSWVLQRRDGDLSRPVQLELLVRA